MCRFGCICRHPQARSRAGSAAAICAAVALAGCAAPQDFMHAAGPAARGLASLGWFALLLFSAVTVVVWLLLFWITLRRKGTLAEHAPIDANGGQRWIVVGGFLLPAAILAIVFISMLQTLAANPMACLDAKGTGTDALCAVGVPEIRVTGQQWWFNAEYLFDPPASNITAPTEIHIPVGRPVDIELETRDVIHSFWVPKLHGKVDLVPGMTNRIRIQADEPGVYQGQCGEYCGMQHAKMRLQVVAQTAEEFQAWMRAQRAPSVEPASDRIRMGRQVFEQAACVVCHTVRGTRAQGQFGPDLTHVASRLYIAGGTLNNDTANLEAWVTHAQSLKPGAQMPDLTQFTGVQLSALAAYLQSLK
jgi:cytochrome c oxidase subunit II